jgi:hypothetical protein
MLQPEAPEREPSAAHYVKVQPMSHHPVTWEVRCLGCTTHAVKQFAYRKNAMSYARALYDPLWSRLLESEIAYAHPRDLPHVPHDNCTGRVRLVAGEHLFGNPDPDN